MPIDDDVLRQSLVAKFGSRVDLESQPGILNDILQEIDRQKLDRTRFDGKDGYDKHYTEGYNKMDYSKSDYSRYDKTNTPEDLMKEVILEVRPELDKLILDRIRARGFQGRATGPTP